MKIGLIARADATGLATQTYEFWRHMKPAKTIVIRPAWNGALKFNPALYPGAEIHTTRFPDTLIEPDPVFERFLEGLDVVFTAETPYNYWIYNRARELGVRTVQQYNFEFFDHLMFGDMPTPDLFAAPSQWRLSDVPFKNKVFLPVPVARDVLPYRQRRSLRTILHVAGIPTGHDRNGTPTVIEAMRLLPAGTNIRLRLRSQYHVDNPCPDRIEIVQTTIEHYWNLYGDEDVMVFPRKFGGLCLAVGTMVETLSGRKPIEEVAVGEQVIDGGSGATVTGKSRREVQESVTIPLRGTSITSSVDHLHLVAKTASGDLREVRADAVRPGNWMFVARPRPAGVLSVRVGPRPKLQGLVRWKGTVKLDKGWARLIGLFLAEGSRGLYSRCDRSGRATAQLCWHFGAGEKWLADETAQLLRDRGLNPYVTKLFCKGATYGPSTTWIVRCRSMWLYELFDNLGMGRGARGKRAPDLDAALVPDLVGGWLDGDGCVYQGTIEGYSESRELIADLWRLLAKVGVLGSTARDGRALRVSSREPAALVSSWTKRLRIKKDYQRDARQSRDWRARDNGWMVRVRSVKRKSHPLQVVAIETSSGRYIANDVITHNCLPMQEALSCGMPVIAPAIDPQVKFLPYRSLVPATKVGEFMARCMIDLFEVDPRALADRILEFYRHPELVSALSAQADDYADRISWERLEPLYRRTFQRLIDGEIGRPR